MEFEIQDNLEPNKEEEQKYCIYQMEDKSHKKILNREMNKLSTQKFQQKSLIIIEMKKKVLLWMVLSQNLGDTKMKRLRLSQQYLSQKRGLSILFLVAKQHNRSMVQYLEPIAPHQILVSQLVSQGMIKALKFQNYYLFLFLCKEFVIKESMQELVTKFGTQCVV